MDQSYQLAVTLVGVRDYTINVYATDEVACLRCAQVQHPIVGTANR